MKIGSYIAKGFNPKEVELGCFETKSGSYVSYSRLGEKQMLECSKNNGKRFAPNYKDGKPARARRDS